MGQTVGTLAPLCTTMYSILVAHVTVFIFIKSYPSINLIALGLDSASETPTFSLGLAPEDPESLRH